MKTWIVVSSVRNPALTTSLRMRTCKYIASFFVPGQLFISELLVLDGRTVMYSGSVLQKKKFANWVSVTYSMYRVIMKSTFESTGLFIIAIGVLNFFLCMYLKPSYTICRCLLTN